MFKNLFNLFRSNKSENDILNELNSSQKAAVTAQEKQICVIAGPGCGKTKTLISRVDYLINSKNINPSSILLITFSRKATREISNRAIVLFGKKLASRLWINNVHGFCFKFLKSLNSSFIKICDANNQKAIIKKILKKEFDSAKGRIEKEIKEIISFIDKTKREYYYQDDIINTLKENRENDFNIKITKLYQEYLLEEKFLDYNDLLIKTFQILRDDNEIRYKVQAKFTNILIDEFQDISNIHLAIIKLIIGKNTKQFIVGDPNQSIYKFQGSSMEFIQNIENNQDWKKFYLNINYRSTNEIIKVGNDFITNNEESLIKNLIQSNDKEKNGERVKLEYKIINFGRIVDRIEVIKKEKKLDFSDFAIIYRKNNLSTSIEEELVLKKIPYEILGSYKFIEREEIKDVLAYLRAIIYRDKSSSSRILYLIDKIGETTVEFIENKSEEENQDILTFLSNFFGKNKKKEFAKSLKNIQQSNIDKFIDQINNQVDILNSSKKLSIFLDEMLQQLGYFEYLKTKEEERAENVQQLFNMVLKWETKNETKQDLKTSINDFLNYLAISFDDSDSKNSLDNVVIATVHQVKGLEFKIVFFIYLDENIIPIERKNSDSFEDETNEEKRIFYVGITRAKEILYLVSSIKPSKFLSNLDLSLTNELVYNLSEEVKEKLNFTKLKQQNYLEIEDIKSSEDKNYEVGIIIKIEKTKRKNALPNDEFYYVAIISFENNNEDRKIYFWKNSLDSEKWSLIERLKREDVIKLKGLWSSNFFSVKDFKLIESPLISSWPIMRRKIEDIKKMKLAFIDVETTNHDVRNKVVEIGYGVYDWEKPLFKKNHLILPRNLNLKKKISFYNNITYKELKGSLSWEDLILTIQEDLKDCILISHNFKSTEYHHLRIGKFFQPQITYHFIDTLDLAKEVLKEKKLASYSLENLIRLIRNDQNFIEEHRALADALLHQELFFYLIKNLKEINLLYRIH